MNLNVKNIITQLTGNKAKVSFAIVLLCFGMLLWGRLRLKKVPRTALATPAVVAVDQTDTNAVVNSASENNTSGEQVVAVTLKKTVQRNLFRLDPKFYPGYKNSAINIGRGAKSPFNPADVITEDQAAELAVLTEAQKLTLQSTLLGANKRAMINGKLLSPGGKIQGFELLEIRSRQVTLRKNGIKVVLEM